MSINELVGFNKQSSDLQYVPVKVRYQESTTINAGQYFRVTLPKIADDLLDLRSLRLKFTLTVSSSDADVYVDATDIGAIFNRVRALSGSTVLMDISEAGLLMQQETHMMASAHDNQYDHYLMGNGTVVERQGWADAAREYVTRVGPKGSLLNCNSLLPLSRMSSLHIDFWLSTGAQVLHSSTDSSATYSLSNVELLAEYVRSPSLNGYFAQTPVSFSVTDYSHRFNNVTAQQNLIRLSSNHSSLNSILTVIRPTTQPGAIGTADKMATFYSGANFSALNVFVNSQLLFEEDINSIEEMWLQAKRAFPDISRSEFFTTLYATTRNVIALNLRSSPPDFHHRVSSGVKTSNLNSDVVVRLTYTGTPGSALQADSFLSSDARVYLDNRSGELKIEF